MSDKYASGQVSENALFTDLGLLDYQAAYALQSRLADLRKEGGLARDLFLMVEHPRVFTLGRRGGRENLTVSEAFLAAEEVPVIQVERGGNITYHGPGQVVLYPIIDLEAARLSVTDYVDSLEEAMIRVCGEHGVPAERNEKNPGIWVGARKLGSVGIALRHGVSYHGLALNVNLSLIPFGWINPCGMAGVSMTSMATERTAPLEMAAVKNSLKGHLSDIFGVAFEDTPAGALPAQPPADPRKTAGE